MRILALETSGLAGSIAAWDELTLVEIELDPKRRTAQTLAPTIAELLRRASWQPADVNLIAVTQGPGSFTGLRIGITAAKTFAFATGAAVVGVNTLAAIACQTPATSELLWVVMDAEREQLYAASFRRLDGSWEEQEKTRILDRSAWLKDLAPGMAVSGPGLKGLREQIPAEVRLVAETDWSPRAGNVGRLGLKKFQQGERSDCWSLLPNYYRESAAVEKARGN